MKKILTIFLALLLGLGITSCSGSDEEYFKELKTSCYNVYDHLRPLYEKSKSVEDLHRVIYDFAKENKLFSKNLPNNGILVTKDGTFPSKPDPNHVTLHCSISLANLKEAAQCSALAFSILMHADKNANISIIFTDNTSAVSLPKNYLKNTGQLIDLSYSKETKLYDSSAATAQFSLSRTFTRQAPAYEKAYLISISGLNGGDSGDQSASHPNPIITLGNIIASCQNSDLLFQVASFSGGTSADTFPTYASAVIVVNANDEYQFIQRFESAKESFKEKYGNSEPSANFIYEATTLPQSVLSSDDTAKLASLMYTLEDGVFATTEPEGKGDPTTLSNVGMVSMTKDSLNVSIFGRGITSADTEKLKTSYLQIANLNDLTFTMEDSTTPWIKQKKNQMVDNFLAACKQGGLKLFPSISFFKSSCAIFSEKNPKLKMLSIGFSIQDAGEVSKSIALYIKSLRHAT